MIPQANAGKIKPLKGLEILAVESLETAIKLVFQPRN